MKWTRYSALLDRLGTAQADHAAKMNEASGPVGRRLREIRKAMGFEEEESSGSRSS